MDWSRHEKLSKEWREKGMAFVAGVNRFVEVGLAKGWDAAGEPPEDDRAPLAGDVLAIVEEANKTDAWRELRAHFPPAHEPFQDRLNEMAVGIDDVMWVDNEQLLARIGTPWQPDTVVLELGLDGSYAATDARAFGRSPDRRWIALLREDVVEIRDGYRGDVRVRLHIPGDDEPVITIAVFPEGDEVLLTRADGVFVLGEEGLRALPFRDEEDEEDEEDDEDAPADRPMVHAAMSPDGTLIAYGEQASSHFVCTRDGRRVARFGPIHSEYPHHVAFSPDGQYAIFNSCHFYNGVTSIVSSRDLRGLVREAYEEDPRVRTLEPACRVYASTFVDGAFVLGNAYGYLHAVTPDATPAWQLFCGSSIGGVDLSADGTKLAVSTAAGYAQIYDVDVVDRDLFQIGTAPHRERLRFVQWKGRPLLRW